VSFEIGLEGDLRFKRSEILWTEKEELRRKRKTYIKNNN
jgi:hypothetical protein